jgi:hypothetical protein
MIERIDVPADDPSSFVESEVVVYSFIPCNIALDFFLYSYYYEKAGVSLQ